MMLNVDIEELNRTASALSDISSDIYHRINDIQNIVSEIENSWISEYTRLYTQAYDEISAEIKKNSEDIKTLSDEFLEMAGKISETEEMIEEIIEY